MRLDEIRDVLGCEVLTGGNHLEVEVDVVLASDGMSEILTCQSPGGLMITGLATVHSVRTADVGDLSAIVFVRGKRPNEKVVELARQKGIPLLATQLGMFDVCAILRERGLRGAL